MEPNKAMETLRFTQKAASKDLILAIKTSTIACSMEAAKSFIVGSNFASLSRFATAVFNICLVTDIV